MYYNGENGYLSLLKDTLANGENKLTRNGNVISSFGSMIHFKDISTAFPLITSKKMFFRGIVEELLWFLRGSTNANELKSKNVHIWDGNSTREYLDSIGLDYPEGELGPVYGWQWRKFGKEYEHCNEETEEDIYNDMNGSESSESSETDATYKGVDQIKYILEELSKENNSRRAVLSGWNPVDLKKMALPPCHMMAQFYVNNGKLSCQMYQRSADMFLGIPFNIASYALFTHMIAQVCNLEVGELIITIGDAHIYENHIEQVREQLTRKPIELATLKLNSEIDVITEFDMSDVELLDYVSHEAIKAPMAR